MKKLISIILFHLSFVAITVQAQQDPLYAQYYNNPFVINPAYSGLQNNLSTSIGYRQQWAGFEGSPKTINFNGHIALFDNKMAGGLIVVSDQFGANTTNEFFLTYSYQIKFEKNAILSFGLQCGAANYQTNNDKLNPQDRTDEFYTGTISEFKPSFGAGVILASKKLFLSFSIPRMIKSNLNQQGMQATLYSQHFYGLGSYLFPLNENLGFKPSVLLKYVSGAPASVDLNASFIIHEKYQAGILTRNFNTYGWVIQAMIRDFRLGYVFEVPTGKSIGTDFKTHEVTLGIRMNVLRFHNNTSGLNF